MTVWIKSPARHLLRTLIRTKLYLIAGFFATVAFWVSQNFGEASLEQVLYHLQFGMEGLVDTDAGLVRDFVVTCITFPLLIAVTLSGLEWALAWLISHGRGRFVWYRGWVQRTVKGLYWAINHRAPFYALLAAALYFCMQFSVMAFIHHKFGQDYFASHYLDPHRVEIKLKKPKNLVMIYVESLEASYRNSQVFGANLIQPLDGLGGAHFQEYLQAPGTGWTIAGITATQCGLPLQSVSLYDINGNGENIKRFLPRAVCMGDILHHFGYYNVYMGGDGLPFSGKGKFFSNHHYDEVYGRDELKGTLTDSQLNFWGLYDDDLIRHAKQKIEQLHAKRRPFNFVMTTIDTHGPDGHYSQTCKQQGAQDFSAIVNCTANQVKGLVDWMRAQGILKDTQVVIVGDHLAMENPMYNKLEAVPQRTIYNQWITIKPIHKNRERILHFDVFPTVLEILGFRITGGRLGLGYSAIDTNVIPPSNTLDEMNEDLLNESPEYLELWKPVADQPANK